MAKALSETRIAGRSERKRLPISDAPYWRGIDPEVHLGYRKGKRGGVWLVRWRAGAGYRQRKLGTADDELSEGTLDFDAAVKAARQVVEEERLRERAEAQGPLLTVRAAVEAYMDIRDARERERRGREVRSDARGRLEKYLTGRPARGRRSAIEGVALAEVALHTLAESDLLAWRATLPATLKRTTKQRLVNDLKASLNEAYASNRCRLPSTFSATVKYGLRDAGQQDDGSDSVARENQILSDAQVAKLISAARTIDEAGDWQGDLFRLVVLMAATGARFSQIARMRVADVQVESSRVLVPASRKGKGAKNLHTPVPVGSDVLKALEPATAGRQPTATLLERWRSKQVPGSIRWEPVERGPWQTPSEIVRPWGQIRAEAGLSEAIPYSLRHSSIVRCIKANLPIRLVAALHDTSVAMIERHYGRFIADGLEELAARAVVQLVQSAAEREAA